MTIFDLVLLLSAFPSSVVNVRLAGAGVTAIVGGAVLAYQVSSNVIEAGEVGLSSQWG